MAFEPLQLRGNGECLLVAGNWVILKLHLQVRYPRILQSPQLLFEGSPNAAWLFDVEDCAAAGRTEVIQEILVPVVPDAQAADTDVLPGSGTGSGQASLGVSIGVAVSQDYDMVDLAI